MKKLFRTLALSALTLLATASLVYADIAPLPEPEPVKSRSGILIVIGLIIIALAVLRIVLQKRK